MFIDGVEPALSPSSLCLICECCLDVLGRPIFTWIVGQVRIGWTDSGKLVNNVIEKDMIYDLYGLPDVVYSWKKSYAIAVHIVKFSTPELRMRAVFLPTAVESTFTWR